MKTGSCIHHVEIGITGGLKTVEAFVSKLPFKVCALRNGKGVNQWLLQPHSGRYVRFLLTEITCKHEVVKDPYSTLWFAEENSKFPPADSAFNISLEVNDVHSFASIFEEQGGVIIKHTTTVHDDAGCVHFCVVKSIVGNVVHTIIDAHEYHGLFLPGFRPPEDILFHSPSADAMSVLISHIDHITFACDVGYSNVIIEWYTKHFRMKRFFINGAEDKRDGLVIDGDDIGLRLKALEYWKCAETGLQSSSDSELKNFKIVIAEALPKQGPNQISNFLSQHGGAGVQHIGLHTTNMIDTIRVLKTCGVEFAEPPVTYYTEIGRLHDIEDIGLDLSILKELGILIDVEMDDELKDSDETAGCGQTKRYLMQKFTKPLFTQDTFFLEIIQRIGATGFGSGNIKALWRSIHACMNQTDIVKDS